MPTLKIYDLTQVIAPKQATKGKDATKQRHEKAQRCKQTHTKREKKACEAC